MTAIEIYIYFTHAQYNAAMRQQKNSRRCLKFKETEDSSCTICGCRDTQMSSPSQWKNEQARKLATSLQVHTNSLVCRPCRQDVSRLLADHTYVPRWREKKDCSDRSYLSREDTASTNFTRRFFSAKIRHFAGNVTSSRK